MYLYAYGHVEHFHWSHLCTRKYRKKKKKNKAEQTVETVEKVEVKESDKRTPAQVAYDKVQEQRVKLTQF